MEMVDLGTWRFGVAEEVVPANLAEPPSLAQIKQLQDALGELEQVECPVEHFFAPGLYTRKCTIPAKSVVVGKMHRHQHPTFLLSGTVRINTDKGMETITGPHIWISQEDAKRALYTVTECVFATVHLNPTDTTDMQAIEADVIVPEALIEYDRPKELAALTDALQGVYA
jgi:hypothetical protein